MRKLVSLFMSFTMAATFSFPAFADENACNANFEQPPPAQLIPADVVLEGVRLVQDRSPSVITSKRDPQYKPTLNRLIRMMADTAYVNRVRDDVLEKGEMRLGHRLPSGMSVELKYVIDRRSGELVFHLHSVSVSRPNGINTKVDESPVSDDGSVLTVDTVVVGRQTLNPGTANEYSESEPLTQEQLDSSNMDDKTRITTAVQAAGVFQVPVEIKGPVLTALLPWLDHMPHLSRSEVRRALDRNQITAITWKARFKAVLAEMAKIARKQTLKYMMIGGLLLAFTHFSTLQLDRDTTPINSPPTVEEVLTEQPAPPPLRGDEKTGAEIDQMVEEMRSAETRGARIYFGDSNMEVWEVMGDDTVPSQVMRQGFLIIELEGQNKMIVIANSPTGGHAVSILDRAANAEQFNAYHRMIGE